MTLARSSPNSDLDLAASSIATDCQHATVAYSPSEIAHRYGKNVHILRDPLALAIDLLAVLLTGGVLYLKTSAFPAIDANVSARPVWKQIEPVRDQVCLVEPLQRHWRYGLNYYSVTQLPDCAARMLPYRVEHTPGEVPVVRR